MRHARPLSYASVLSLPACGASAGCVIEGGNVSMLGNDFGAIHAVVDRATECAGEGVFVEPNLTTER